MRNRLHRDRWITGCLGLFCGIMTWLLVRSEYFPESSPFHRLPPGYVAERFLKNESLSSMKVTWKGEDVGSLTVRVTPGERPLVSGATSLVLPVLGQKPRLHLDLECRLKHNREMERVRLRGKLHEMNFDVTADTATDRLQLEARGPAVDVKREFSLNDMSRSGGRKVFEEMPDLANQASLPSQDAVAAMARGWQMTASSSRIHRLGDWMEAYLVEARLDANSWAKLWISPTGELLKLESSFGLSAINTDFFEGAPADGVKG
ncbi:MAG: hypothetical protein HY360_23985 [Verrucomicrobia bacterium]|nr:hypothetical protein [Verrucomicrobiota bacterium]